MFNPFKKRRFHPQKLSGAESHGESGVVAFSNSERTWEERYDLIEGLTALLQNEGIECQMDNGWILVDQKIYLRPEMAYILPLESAGVNTTSIIYVCNEAFASDGFFEYQHATGDNTQESFNAGFASWLKVDLPAIRDAFIESGSTCMTMEMSFDDSRPTRRAVLGPVFHLATKNLQQDEEHPFCPCCLLTNAFESFKPYFEREGTVAIRLLSVRDEEGDVSADCRINGIDFPEGESALMAYAMTWPDRGYEMRKQYVIIRSVVTP